ncbi:LysR family substrate-binding domain-containing protein [Microbacterium sp. LRZ72]|uniref:LysR family substrate-binding domain-containing protein n=1 Tax=Microbacterium sp. LRZ72 TaxID=2942481 RepID=UPI0029A7A9E6|nr:LysR family substrate-binding domain-containing protein [Microbacterium sp. LRZ72]MDX2376680.1 LysR family substrate-binding domain-containing protein [Microbacterium sp. LRZ72]
MPAPESSTGAPPPRTGVFCLGAIPGATPGTWISRWRERLPGVDLVLVPIAARDARRVLDDRSVDAALVRLPIPGDGLHMIPLYDEIPVVVFGEDSSLAAADELQPEDLRGEVRVIPDDDVLPGLHLPQTTTPRFAAPASTEEAIALVATGAAIVIVPQSLARLHRRRDVSYRPLARGPASTVALAWLADRTTPDVEDFVGIVRGRTARSSRG